MDRRGGQPLGRTDYRFLVNGPVGYDVLSKPELEVPQGAVGSRGVHQK